MPHKRKTIQNTVYSLAGLLGLLCIVWLVFSFKNANNDHKTQVTHATPAISSNNDKQPVKPILDQAKSSVEKTKEVAISATDTELGQCSARCTSTLSMLDENLELDDRTFEKLQIYAKEIAAYLQNNDSQRQYYLEMALTTDDGDKRAFLTDVFTHLPYRQKLELGENFIGSENWRVRADGVTLVADHDTSELEAANTLMNIFSSEENAFIKDRILGYLKQSSTLQGDAEILHQLDSAIYNEIDPAVRVSAFKAKMQLSEQPYHMLPDALQALRTSEPTLQFASIVAIERILKHEEEYAERGVYIDTNSIRNEFEIIRTLSVYDDDKERFDRLIQEANSIYSRYFE